MLSLAGECTQLAVPALHQALAKAVFTCPRAKSLQWLEPLSRAQDGQLLCHFLTCVLRTDSDFNAEAEALGASEGTIERAQLLALRGQPCWRCAGTLLDVAPPRCLRNKRAVRNHLFPSRARYVQVSSLPQITLRACITMSWRLLHHDWLAALDGLQGQRKDEHGGCHSLQQTSPTNAVSSSTPTKL